MLRGVATVNIYAADHAAASRWYAELLGTAPYFQVPGYHEFRIGDHQVELGIIERSYAPEGEPDVPGGAVVHWHVDDLTATLDRLLALGATLRQPVTERGEGFVTASVVDPFGNVLGVMTNPHYLEMLDRDHA
ncbi:VOC family protein [Cellulomonas sp. NS3]|uniref:VOC family protein n=1 Tax=Cellulomonas sp. NS3 TaxID=2973977 RepID=UPI0021626C14|nr:VOC family protein [Cellulomonas sp. NS3]